MEVIEVWVSLAPFGDCMEGNTHRPTGTRDIAEGFLLHRADASCLTSLPIGCRFHPTQASCSPHWWSVGYIESSARPQIIRTTFTRNPGIHRCSRVSLCMAMTKTRDSSATQSTTPTTWFPKTHSPWRLTYKEAREIYMRDWNSYQCLPGTIDLWFVWRARIGCVSWQKP